MEGLPLTYKVPEIVLMEVVAEVAPVLRKERLVLPGTRDVVKAPHLLKRGRLRLEAGAVEELPVGAIADQDWEEQAERAVSLFWLYLV